MRGGEPRVLWLVREPRVLQGPCVAPGWGSHVLLPGGEPRVLRESLVLLNHGRASCVLGGGYVRSLVCSGPLYMGGYE